MLEKDDVILATEIVTAAKLICDQVQIKAGTSNLNLVTNLIFAIWQYNNQPVNALHDLLQNPNLMQNNTGQPGSESDGEDDRWFVPANK